MTDNLAVKLSFAVSHIFAVSDVFQLVSGHCHQTLASLVEEGTSTRSSRNNSWLEVFLEIMFNSLQPKPVNSIGSKSVVNYGWQLQSRSD